jgi:GNAT superfamily N-acetyltransferase
VPYAKGSRLRRDLHGQGLGAELLVYALTTIVTAARSAGGRLVVVDALDDGAVDFYRAHDFQPSRTDPCRLIMKLSTAALALRCGSSSRGAGSEAGRTIV